jgi:hypothetical protein
MSIPIGFTGKRRSLFPIPDAQTVKEKEESYTTSALKRLFSGPKKEEKAESQKNG